MKVIKYKILFSWCLEIAKPTSVWHHIVFNVLPLYADSENWRHILWSQSETTDASGGSILSDGTVWLRAATPEHEGWYRCTARAQHSYLHHIFYLDVRGKANDL